MDEQILAMLGLDIGIVAGILIATEMAKKYDVKGRFKKFYIFIPLLLSIGMCFITVTPFTLLTYIRSVFVYALVTMGAFTFAKRWKFYRNLFGIADPTNPDESDVATRPSLPTPPAAAASTPAPVTVPDSAKGG